MVCFSKTVLLDLMNQLCSPNPRCISTSGLGSFYFARHYFRNRFFFLFLWVLRCFSSPRSLLIYYFTHIWIVGLFFPTEFPHSEISGYIGYVLLTKAFRSLSRPSSAFGAQAFTLRSQQLNLLCFCLTFGFIVYSYEYSSLPFFLEYLIYSTIYFSMCYSLKQYTSFYVVRFLRDFVNIQLVLFPRHSSSSQYNSHLVLNIFVLICFRI